MKKILIACSVLFSFILPLSAGEASSIAADAAKKLKAEDSIKFVEEKLKTVKAPAEKRSLFIFLGTVQEQLGNFDLARENYVAAAGISAADAEGMPKKSNEQLVLDAVRCALSLGDASLADSYLNSAVRNSESAEIQAYIILYSQWSSLCKAMDAQQLGETLVMLEAYAQRSSLAAVHPQLFLTLWYVTGQEKWSEKLKSDFPKSVEAAVVAGKAQLLPSPFWFFVPRTGVAQPEIADEEIQPASVQLQAESSQAQEQSETVPAVSDCSSEEQPSEKPLYLQLGLFREKDNAQVLVNRLKEKGFSGRILSEKRPSGTVYYIVAVDDVNGKTAGELRNAGFDCYPVF